MSSEITFKLTSIAKSDLSNLLANESLQVTKVYLTDAQSNTNASYVSGLSGNIVFDSDVSGIIYYEKDGVIYEKSAFPSGETPDDAFLHIEFFDISEDTYSAKTIAITYNKSNEERILCIATGSTSSDVIVDKHLMPLSFSLDLKFDDAAQIVFQNVNVIFPPATETIRGSVKLATNLDVLNGTGNNVVTSQNLQSRLVAERTESNNTYVNLTENQSISGNKTFNNNINVNGNFNFSNNSLIASSNSEKISVSITKPTDYLYNGTSSSLLIKNNGIETNVFNIRETSSTSASIENSNDFILYQKEETLAYTSNAGNTVTLTGRTLTFFNDYTEDYSATSTGNTDAFFSYYANDPFYGVIAPVSIGSLKIKGKYFVPAMGTMTDDASFYIELTNITPTVISTGAIQLCEAKKSDGSSFEPDDLEDGDLIIPEPTAIIQASYNTTNNKTIINFIGKPSSVEGGASLYADHFIGNGGVSGASFVGDLNGDVNGNATTSNALSTSRNINGLDFDGSTDVIAYGVCDTAANIITKIVTINNFTLKTGSLFCVKFSNTNTAANPKLLINSGTSYNIKQKDSTNVGTTVGTSWSANSILVLVFDGSDFYILSDSLSGIGNNISTCNSSGNLVSELPDMSLSNNHRALCLTNGNNNVHSFVGISGIVANTLRGYSAYGYGSSISDVTLTSSFGSVGSVGLFKLSTSYSSSLQPGELITGSDLTPVALGINASNQIHYRQPSGSTTQMQGSWSALCAIKARDSFYENIGLFIRIF